jgi:hypothetical protein
MSVQTTAERLPQGMAVDSATRLRDLFLGGTYTKEEAGRLAAGLVPLPRP